MDPREARLLRMRRAAAVAGKVLAELWPEGPDGAVRETVDLMYFEVVAERGGVTVRRQAELRDSWIWDVIELGNRPPYALPRGARLSEPESREGPGRVSVNIPRRWWRRTRRPVYWTEDEIESLSRRLNEIDEAVLGIVESRCRVCGYDDGDERFVGGAPQYVICHCCESDSGVDDSRPAEVAGARRAWVEGGRQWRYPNDRPVDWDADAALAALPPKWRDL